MNQLLITVARTIGFKPANELYMWHHYSGKFAPLAGSRVGSTRAAILAGLPLQWRRNELQ